MERELRRLLEAEHLVVNTLASMFDDQGWECMPDGRWAINADDYQQLRAVLGAWDRAVDRYAEATTAGLAD